MGVFDFFFGGGRGREGERGLVCFWFAWFFCCYLLPPLPKLFWSDRFPFLSVWIFLLVKPCWELLLTERHKKPLSFHRALATALPERTCRSPARPGRLLTPRGGARPCRRWRSPRGGAVAWDGAPTRSRGAGAGPRDKACADTLCANTWVYRAPTSGCLCTLPHAVRVLGLLKNSLCYFSRVHPTLFFCTQNCSFTPGAVWDHRAVHPGVLWTVYQGGFSMENHVVGRWSSPLKLTGWKEWLCFTPALITDR